MCEPEGGSEQAKWALGKEAVSRGRPAKPWRRELQGAQRRPRASESRSVNGVGPIGPSALVLHKVGNCRVFLCIRVPGSHQSSTDTCGSSYTFIFH